MAEDLIEIHQQWAPGFGVKVKLLNGRELHVEKKSKPNRTKYTIDLLALEDESKEKTVLGWKWFVSGLAALLLMVLCIIFLPMSEDSMLYMVSVYILGPGMSAGCFYKAYKDTSRKQIFHSRSANVHCADGHQRSCWSRLAAIFCPPLTDSLKDIVDNCGNFETLNMPEVFILAYLFIPERVREQLAAWVEYARTNNPQNQNSNCVAQIKTAG